MHLRNYISPSNFVEDGSEMRSLGAGFQSENCCGGARLHRCTIVLNMTVVAFLGNHDQKGELVWLPDTDHNDLQKK